MRMNSNRWHERDGGARLTHDRALIVERYPGLSYRIHAVSKRILLEGHLILRGDSGVPERIEIRIEFSDQYPFQEPTIIEVGKRFPHIVDRHFHANGACCLWLPPKSRWKGHEPDGLLSFLDEAVLFFDRQLICDVVGYFPGPQWGQGYEGYIEYVQEQLGNDRVFVALVPVFTTDLNPGRNDLCPCGKSRKYKHCHLPTVESIRREVGPEMLRAAFRDFVRRALAKGNYAYNKSERSEQIFY